MNGVRVHGVGVNGDAAENRLAGKGAQAWDEGVQLWYTCAIRMGVQFSNSSMVRSDAGCAAARVRA